MLKKKDAGAENKNYGEPIIEQDDVSGQRKMPNHILYLVVLLGLGLSIFTLYTGYFGLLVAERQRSIHLLFSIIIAFILYPGMRKKKYKSVPWYDWIWIAGCIAGLLYIAINIEKISSRAGMVTILDQVMGWVTIIAVLEGARRVMGWILPAIGVLMLLYCKFGYLAGGVFWHPGFSWRSIIRHMYLGHDGLFSTPLAVSANYIAIFILFGTALQVVGVGDAFMTFAKGLFGSATGGPAKVAVLGSGMFATLSGSSTSNVATTGAFTIPLMKKLGYQPYFAGAVEAAASMGGQVTPPVMGAVAFIMAEFLGVSYVTIMLAAALPALMYFIGVFTVVHFESVKTGLRGLSKSELPDWKPVLLRRGYMLLPAVVLVAVLLGGYTPLAAGFWAFWSAILLSFFRKDTRLSWRIFIFDVLSSAGRKMLTVAMPSAIAGFVVGAATLTGITPMLAAYLGTMATTNLLFTMFIVMIMCLILGMGVPTPANYILMTIMTIPILLKAGIFPLSAHLFSFYFAIMAELTPPVAITAYTASALAGADFWKTAFTAVRLAAVAYIVPYFFVLNPSMLLGQEPFSAAVFFSTVTCILGSVTMGASLAGFILTRTKWYERIALFGATFFFIDPRAMTDLVALVLLAGVLLLQRSRIRKRESVLQAQ